MTSNQIRSNNDHFVADGPARHAAAPEHQARLAEIERTVAEAYAPRLAAAGFWGRLWLRRQMRREVAARVAELSPSPDSLWLNCGAVATQR